MIAVACHPGRSPTEISRYMSKTALFLANPLLRWISHPPPAGALPTLRAATDPEVSGGRYFGPANRFEMSGPPVLVRSSSASHDVDSARRLWDLSVDLTGMDPGI